MQDIPVAGKLLFSHSLFFYLALVLAEIWCMMNLTHWALPVVGITAVVCVMNIREVLSMLDTLLAKFVKKKK